MSLYRELKRRNVFRVAIAYLALAWLVIEVAGTVFPVFGIPDWGVRLFVVAFALGFVPALIISWVYEITPEGLKREKEVVREASITHLTAKRLDVFTIGVVVVALAFILADRLWMSPRFAEQSVDLSPEGDQEYFSDGISEEILNALAHISELHVISRSSAFSFKGKGLDIPTIAEQLGVANILEGSVRKSGNQVRITAQLIDARTDAHVWSATYNRDLVDIFAIQDEISAAIVEALRQQLGLRIATMPRAITAVNVEAHEAYLRGRHLQLQRTTDTLKRAVLEFEKAVAHDPDYALAHAELAITTLLLSRRNYGDLTTTEVVARAAPPVERAMMLDPALAEAHAAAGFLMHAQRKFQKALAHYEKVVEINPNYAIVYTWRGNINQALSHYGDYLAMTEMSLRLDPLSHPANYNYLMQLIARNRLNDVDRQLEKFIAVIPSYEPTLRGLRSSLGGKWTDYVIGRMDNLQKNPTNLETRRALSGLFATLGLEKEALDIYGPPKPFVLRWLGKPEHAIEIAQARVDEDPMDVWERRSLGLALASAGDCIRAQPILEEIWQLNDGRITYDYLFRIAEAVALIVCRRTAGEDVDDVVTAIRDNVRRYRDAGMTRADSLHHAVSVDYEEGLVEFLTGEREKGLELIAKAVEEGFFIPPNDAYLQVLYDDPGFAPIRAMQEARQKRERDRFLSIVCTDNPYAAVWQPAEGTCERFAAEGKN
jgi:TolB-like protein